MITNRLATLASICLIIGGCATAFPNPQQSSSPQPAPVQQAPGFGATANTGGNPGAAQAFADVQGLQREIRELRDRVERQEFELERLRTRQRDLYDDLDQRLRNAERTAASGGGQSGGGSFSSATPGGTPTVGQGGIQIGGQDIGGQSGSTGTGATQGSGGITIASPNIGDDAAAAGQGAQGQTSGNDTTPGQVAIVQPQMDGGTSSGSGGGAVSVSAQEAYDQAFGLLKQSRYADAVQAFEAFIRDNPANDLTDDAYYWLAEARYVTREFEAALNGFRTVTANFPNSQRVPASYLKIGYIQYEIGAYTDARDTLSYIMKNFPTHRVAVSAETRLKKMDREGR